MNARTHAETAAQWAEGSLSCANYTHSDVSPIVDPLTSIAHALTAVALSLTSGASPTHLEITVEDRSTARMLRDHISEWLQSEDRTDALALLAKVLSTEPRAAVSLPVEEPQ